MPTTKPDRYGTVAASLVNTILELGEMLEREPRPWYREDIEQQLEQARSLLARLTKHPS